MLSDYERELSTHYAQVRKRLRGEPPKRIMAIPPRQKDITSPSDVEPPPVVGPETERIPDFVLYVNNKPLVRTLVFSKRDFVVIENDPEAKPIKCRKIMDVLKDVSRETGVPPNVILGHRRMKYITQARWAFWWRAAQECPHLSIADIGRRSNVDHTSVLYGLKKYAEMNGLPYARGSVE
jgi:Bacterial dnaA protein helix-turn-helix